MKIEKNYHCFACGVGGDVIDYVSRMFGLSQFQAALKLVEDFNLPVEVKGASALNEQEKTKIKKEQAERQRLIEIRERFQRWCDQSVELMKSGVEGIRGTGIYVMGKPPDIIFSEYYAQMLHVEPILNYWLDILCLGGTTEKQELFLKGRKKVEKLAEGVRVRRERILDRNRGSA